MTKMGSIQTSFALLGMSLFLWACADDPRPPCGAGTVYENGECVVDNTQEPPGPSLPDNNNEQPGGGDKNPGPGPGPGDTNQNQNCSEAEASSVDFGGACSKDCQCDQSLNGYCYNGPFLEGFRFCSRVGGTTSLNAEVYPTLLYNSACWDFGGDAWNKPITKACQTLDDCKALSAAYTHCGTESFPWSTDRGTQCPDLNPQTGSATMMSSKKVCIIDGLPPYDR